MSKHHINIKELLPNVVALEQWGHNLGNKLVLFFSDNMSVVAIINKQTYTNVVMMHLVRRLVLSVLRFNIHFRANHT